MTATEHRATTGMGTGMDTDMVVVVAVPRTQAQLASLAARTRVVGVPVDLSQPSMVLVAPR